METKLRIRLKRNPDIVTTIPKEQIRAAVWEVYSRPDDPNRPKPNFTMDDIILVPSVVPSKAKKKQNKKKV